MRWIVGFLITVAIVAVGGYIVFTGYPYYMYSRWAKGSHFDRYYYIEHYRPQFLSPTKIEAISPYTEEYAQLWKNFPVRNTLLPLPTRHPLYYTVPLLEVTHKSARPQIGMIIMGASGREVSRISTLPLGVFPNYLQGQELFKLPYFKNKLKRYSSEEIWKELFTRKITVESKKLDDMLLDLYILHLRASFFPKTMKSYGLIGDGRLALIEVESKNKDYIKEIVLSFDNGLIHSYLLTTEVINTESKKLRSKFLREISFGPMDESMGRILYTEFKQLNFARQIDQEGMLYLFSAWTQDIEKVEMFKELIFYLERGLRNQAQLAPLYEFAYKKFGKTFTTRTGTAGAGDYNMQLQRKIELENNQKVQELKKEKPDVTSEGELSPNERMNDYLRKAKEKTQESTEEMVIH